MERVLYCTLVPKKPMISCLNHFLPIALPAVPMKICERFFLKKSCGTVIRPFAKTQFLFIETSYIQSEVDMVILHMLYFLPLSAFNTLQPHTLVNS